MYTTDMSEMNAGQSGSVMYLHHEGAMQRRLYELGLIPGTNIDCIMENKGMKAFFVRGACIALRNSDLKKITVCVK